MPFEQTRLDKPINGRNGTFDRYFYRSADDTLAQIRTSGYFSASRFLENEPENWIGGLIDVVGNDGYALLQVDDDGVSVTDIGGGAGGRVVFVPDDSPFADNAARDVWANANLNDIHNSATQVTRLVVGTSLFEWGGINNPTAQQYTDQAASMWLLLSMDLPQADRDLLDSITNLDSGSVPYFNGTEFQESGAQILADNTMLAPEGFGVESGSIAFGDIAVVSESNSLLSITNAQFNADGLQFDLIDARSRETTPSERPRQFFLTEGQGDGNNGNAGDATPNVPFVIQNVNTQQLTANPLTFSYTVPFTARTNDLRIQTFAAMTNVRIRVRYTDGNQTVLKYFPTKASWLSGEDGINWDLGANTITLNENKFVQQQGDNLTVDVAADNMAMLGDTNGFPFLSGLIQRGEFRELAYMTDVNPAPVAQPRILSLNIAGQPTSVAPGTTLTGSKTFSYVIENPQLVQGQMELVQGSAVLSSAVSPTATMITVTINDATLMAGQAAHFTLRGTSTSGQPFSRDITIRAAQPHEFAYYGIRSTNDFATTDLTNLTSVDVTTNDSFEVSGAFANNAFVGILMPADMDLDDIRFFGQPVTSSFTRTENARTISGQAYVLYILQNTGGIAGQASYLVEL